MAPKTPVKAPKAATRTTRPKHTLKTVSALAEKDREFFRALLKKPAAALEAAGITLSANDLKRLTALIRATKVSGTKITLSLKGLIVNTRFKRDSHDEDWPGPGWPMMWYRARLTGKISVGEITFIELPIPEVPGGTSGPITPASGGTPTGTGGGPPIL